MVESWRSSISVAVLAVGSIGLSHAFVSNLRKCNPRIAQHVDFHLVFADGINGFYSDFNSSGHVVESYASIVVKTAGMFTAKDCQRLTSHGISTYLDGLGSIPDANLSPLAPIPTNLLRNVARMYIRTQYVLVLDAHAVPSRNLATEFERVYHDYRSDEKRRDATMTAFIVPGLLGNAAPRNSNSKRFGI